MCGEIPMMWPSWWIGGCVRVERGTDALQTPRKYRGVSQRFMLPRHIPIISRQIHSRLHHFHIPEARRSDVVASVAVATVRVAEVAGAKGR